MDEDSYHWSDSSCPASHQLSGSLGIILIINDCRTKLNINGSHVCLYTVFILQIVNPSGCQCEHHYVLNAHFKCVRPGHSSSIHVNPTGCSCPVNYHLNSHNRCECISFRSCHTGSYWDSGTCSCRSIIDTCPDCSDIP